MPAYEPENIRNVAVVGHRGTGKTSLVETLLYQSGATNRLGSVEQATTVADWDEEEHRRQMSLSAGLCHLEWHGRKVNLIDTPGDPGFQADTLAALDELWSSSTGGDPVALIDTLEDPEAPEPQSAMAQTELREALGEAITRLPEREKLVVTLYYYEELTLREIGEVLGVTESRVSQLHTKAVLRLKSRLQGEPLSEAI